MKILTTKRYKKLLDYEQKYRELTGQCITFCTGYRSTYKALLSMSKEELVHRYFDLYNTYVQLLRMVGNINDKK